MLSPGDAVRIRDAGADAVYVSNHGGRQLDSAPAAIDALPGIRRAVGPDYPLLFDSGLRDGEDIVKAYALGASYVMLGRPFLYAAGAGGRDGVYRLIELLAEDVGVALAQIGRTDIGALDERVLIRGGAAQPRDSVMLLMVMDGIRRIPICNRNARIDGTARSVNGGMSPCGASSTPEPRSGDGQLRSDTSCS